MKKGFQKMGNEIKNGEQKISRESPRVYIYVVGQTAAVKIKHGKQRAC